MARKVFQIGFILLIIVAFGTVFNHYLKNKISDPNEFLNYINEFPQNRISRIDPIVIVFAQNFNKNDYPLNTPLDENIIKIEPELSGTLYWTSNKTLEFHPDEPLQFNAEYLVRIDLNKVFKAKKKIKPFRFKLLTFKQVFYITNAKFIDIDSSLIKQELTGNIVFNDFIEIENLHKIFSA